MHFTHLRTRLTLGSSDKGCEAFKVCDVNVNFFMTGREKVISVLFQTSLPCHTDDVFLIHPSPPLLL